MRQVENWEQNQIIERFRPFSIIAANAGTRGNLNQIYTNFNDFLIALQNANGNLAKVDWNHFSDNIMSDMMGLCVDPEEVAIIGESTASQALDLFAWIEEWQYDTAHHESLRGDGLLPAAENPFTSQGNTIH